LSEAATIGSTRKPLFGETPSLGKPASIQCPAMAAVKEVTLLEVSAPWIKGSVQVTDWKAVEGARFMKFTKDAKLNRMLLGETVTSTRALTPTSILETVRAQRNSAMADLMSAAVGESSAGPTDDLGLTTRPPRSSPRNA